MQATSNDAAKAKKAAEDTRLILKNKIEIERRQEQATSASQA